MLTTQRLRLSNGKQLRLARVGAGAPLLLLHGYPDNLQIWSELAPRLAERFEVFAFDWPGTGYSDEWPGGATPMHLAERLLWLINEWKLETVSVLGIDMGGQPALAFAAKYPQRIERLIVSNSLVFGDERTSWEIRILRKFGWNRFLLQRMPGIIFRRAERTFLPRGMRLSSELRADFWHAFQQPAVRKFVSKMCAGYQGTLPALPSLYTQIKCPALVLWAERDRHFPLHHGERLQDAIPNSKLAVIPEAEHWMVWYMAEHVAKEVMES